MSYLLEKVSYLKGLAEGMEIDDSSKEGKLLMHIVDLLDDFASAFDELDNDLEELEEYVEDVDGDLADLETYLETVDEDLADLEDELEWEDDLEDYECPACEESFQLEEAWSDDDENLKCPECGDPLLETDTDEDDK